MTTAALPSERLCDRCDVPMELQPLYEGAKRPYWYCPCCRSRLRTVEMLQAEWEADAAERGMTWEEYEAYMNDLSARIVAKPTERDVDQARAMAKERAEEWEPVCPHETENPWKAAS